MYPNAPTLAPETTDPATTLMFNAQDFLTFAKWGAAEDGRTLFHSDRLTAFGLYMLLLLENQAHGGVITYDNDYFEDVASHVADMTADLDTSQVLMYFCNLIDGGLMRMEPGQLMLTLAPATFPEAGYDYVDPEIPDEQVEPVTESAPAAVSEMEAEWDDAVADQNYLDEEQDFENSDGEDDDNDKPIGIPEGD